uniref:Uncharacterized protein n=1 Tax=Anopheles coluzzii TaxID=1518534 RepID=A0A8W7PUL4_ANOCL
MNASGVFGSTFSIIWLMPLSALTAWVVRTFLLPSGSGVRSFGREIRSDCPRKMFFATAGVPRRSACFVFSPNSIDDLLVGLQGVAMVLCPDTELLRRRASPEPIDSWLELAAPRSGTLSNGAAAAFSTSTNILQPRFRRSPIVIWSISFAYMKRAEHEHVFRWNWIRFYSDSQGTQVDPSDKRCCSAAFGQLTSHRWHCISLSSACVRLWPRKLSERPKHLPHTSHRYGFSPVCVRRWILSDLGHANSLSHMGQRCLPFCPFGSSSEPAYAPPPWLPAVTGPLACDALSSSFTLLVDPSIVESSPSSSSGRAAAVGPVVGTPSAPPPAAAASATSCRWRFDLKCSFR